MNKAFIYERGKGINVDIDTINTKKVLIADQSIISLWILPINDNVMINENMITEKLKEIDFNKYNNIIKMNIIILTNKENRLNKKAMIIDEKKNLREGNESLLGLINNFKSLAIEKEFIKKLENMQKLLARKDIMISLREKNKDILNIRYYIDYFSQYLMYLDEKGEVIGHTYDYLFFNILRNNVHFYMPDNSIIPRLYGVGITFHFDVYFFPFSIEFSHVDIVDDIIQTKKIIKDFTAIFERKVFFNVLLRSYCENNIDPKLFDIIQEYINNNPH